MFCSGYKYCAVPFLAYIIKRLRRYSSLYNPSANIIKFNRPVSSQFFRIGALQLNTLADFVDRTTLRHAIFKSSQGSTKYASNDQLRALSQMQCTVSTNRLAAAVSSPNSFRSPTVLATSKIIHSSLNKKHLLRCELAKRNCTCKICPLISSLLHWEANSKEMFIYVPYFQRFKRKSSCPLEFSFAESFCCCMNRIVGGMHQKYHQDDFPYL